MLSERLLQRLTALLDRGHVDRLGSRLPQVSEGRKYPLTNLDAINR